MKLATLHCFVCVVIVNAGTQALVIYLAGCSFKDKTSYEIIRDQLQTKTLMEISYVIKG